MKRKTYKQKTARRNARSLARRPIRESYFTWTKKRVPDGKKREYIIIDDKTKEYITTTSWGVVTKTRHRSYASRFKSADDIIRIIDQLKHTGAWRTIRVK